MARNVISALRASEVLPRHFSGSQNDSYIVAILIVWIETLL